MNEYDRLDYKTRGAITISRQREAIAYEGAIDHLVDALDSRRGAIFSSNYEYPGRYTRWDSGIVDPPIVITTKQNHIKIEALNQRGEILLHVIAPVVEGLNNITLLEITKRTILADVEKTSDQFIEEDRSHKSSVFSVLRAIVDLFFSKEDKSLGLYGAFGYDLAFQFEPIEYKIKRPEDHRDLVLYLPDSVLIVDHYSARAWVDHYDFSFDGKTTKDLPRKTQDEPFQPSTTLPPKGDHTPGEYAQLVRAAKESFKKGDLFEVVPGQTFFEPCQSTPSAISKRLKQTNPSPYSFFINLGEQEYLVGASPEMFVRVSGRRVETCPISGTIKRGQDAISDSEQILKLLNSKKDESELTMCSDVDRNDKSRVCEAGSVRVIGRRQIEIYSRLIHTVDHIEGRLRDGMDAFDAFLSHTWAVTVTGAPKIWAMRFIENHEKSARAWYGGAIGMMHFNGDMNTGLTLRTVRIKDGIASVRAGATLLYDSDPEAEEAETELKASAMIAAIRDSINNNEKTPNIINQKLGQGRTLLLIDHEDSFVHTLANYFRQTGAKVVTVRTPVEEALLDRLSPDLVVLSPGPGAPKDFNMEKTIQHIRQRSIPIFGVCLGLQGLVEAFGGQLDQLDVPMHGKPSRIHIYVPGSVFDGLPNEITVGRYHSIFADPSTLPDVFTITARTHDNVIMGIEHKEEPIAAVQFHPESIMSLGEDAGMRMINNVVSKLLNKVSA
ncbi:anthranilate synthase component I [Bartonella tamiae]|uniref:Anthranilate synthase n=1 Tax=Bartonella tamiae Th239 TaxID=1094558 RepID=J0ZLD7_9HYPH|nr:anthranilate synthase component I [Bartonella tamiae]EJF89223.1 anthranilate synthase [Bartonella tamiae Th239]EJF95373.1 anthranilate synthase [Bartonella tamiae Th307]